MPSSDKHPVADDPPGAVPPGAAPPHWPRRKFLTHIAPAAAVTAWDAYAIGQSAATVHNEAAESRPSIDRRRAPSHQVAEELITDFTLNLHMGEKNVAVRLGHHTHLYALEHLSPKDALTGAEVAAYREVNADGTKAGNLRIIFSGRTSWRESDSEARKGLFPSTPQELEVTARILAGERSPQIPAIDRYFDTVLMPYLQKELKRDPRLSLHLFGHSQGAGNALHAKYRLLKMQQKHPGLSTPGTVLFEPFAAAQEIMEIVQKEFPYSHGECETGKRGAACDLLRKLRAEVVSVRAVPETAVAKFRLPCAAGNMQFAESGGTYLLNHAVEADHSLKSAFENNADRIGQAAGAAAGAALTRPADRHLFAPFRRGAGKRLSRLTGSDIATAGDPASDAPSKISRRDLLRMASTGALLATAGSIAGDELASDIDTNYHTLEASLALLKRTGATALEHPRYPDRLCACDEDLLHPKKISPLSPDSWRDEIASRYEAYSAARASGR